MSRSLRLGVLVAWLLAAGVLCLVDAAGIAGLWFPDPDDAMRLLQVRDWLAGQSWWDVSQHRLWGGTFAMHWSRLVDLPLALVIAPLQPLLGAAVAERIAMVAVPLLTLLVVMALVAKLTATLAGEERARLAVLLTALSPPLLFQLRPMRVDHHGWQIALALGAVVALMLPPTRRTGVAIGLCLGALVTVSLEGLPVTAAITAVALLSWVFDDRRRMQVLAMLGTLFASVVILHVVTRGPGMLLPACDAIAPVWIAGLAIACAGAAATVRFSPPGMVRRLGGLAVSGLAGLAVVRGFAPVCTQGPFATLDPLVYDLWYMHVVEGLPAWRQLPGWIVMAYALPVVGIAGSVAAWRAAEGEARVRWTMTLALAAATFAVSVLVIRAGATANALALPGAAWLLLGWLTRARAIANVPKRIAATAAAFLAAAPGLAGAMIVDRGPPKPAEAVHAGPGAGAPWCDNGREIGDLVRLPAGRVFAPIDVTPEMLAKTPHEGIGAGYHRNAAALHRVMATFLAPPDAARASVEASGADYVAGCPGEAETERYKDLAPQGLWARLERGDRIAWLTPIPIAGSPVLAWRVNRQPLPGNARRP